MKRIMISVQRRKFEGGTRGEDSLGNTNDNFHAKTKTQIYIDTLLQQVDS